MAPWGWGVLGTVVVILVGLAWVLIRKVEPTRPGEVPAVPKLQDHPTENEAARRRARDEELVAEAAAEDDPGNALADLPRRDL